MKKQKIRKYKDCIIEPKTFTTMGYLYSTYCRGRFLRADTLFGVKQLITKTINNEK